MQAVKAEPQDATAATGSQPAAPSATSPGAAAATGTSQGQDGQPQPPPADGEGDEEEFDDDEDDEEAEERRRAAGEEGADERAGAADPWVAALQTQNYNALSLKERIEVLSFLCHSVLDGPTLRAKLDLRIDEAAERRKQLLDEAKVGEENGGGGGRGGEADWEGEGGLGL